MGRLISFLSVLLFAVAPSSAAEKDWTILVFLNGNNNLDSYGAKDINEMEKVGSTENVNVVVQWASMAQPTVKRLYVQKDSLPKQVTSPVVEDIGATDMGSWRNLVAFVEWAKVKYPAKHYFVDIWNHGGGWHLKDRLANDGGFRATDISWDDKTGNVITTEQLGDAAAEMRRILGRKLDIMGADACLMSMAEVTGEMAESVERFVGAQEVEPGDGWPYDGWLNRVAGKPGVTPAEMGKALAEEFRKSYQGGTQGSSEVTLSVLNLAKTDAFETAMQELARKITSMNDGDVAKVRKFASDAQSFYSSDYVDLVDFLNLTESTLFAADRDSLAAIRAAVTDYVETNEVTRGYARAHGVSVWMPTYKYTYSSYKDRYAGLKFNAHTGWAEVLKAWFKNDTSR